MKPILKNEVIGQGARVQLLLPEILRQTVLDTVLEAGMGALREMLEEERSRLCGARYARGVEREAWRAGHAPSELAMGGRRVSMQRPRVRNKDGEIDLPEWEHARLEAQKEVRKRHAEGYAAVTEGVHLMRKPRDGRLFLLACALPEKLGRRFAFWSTVHLVFFIGAGTAALFMF